jgi:pimeloyl-ACP methyl ester carboxylesterase
MSDFITYKNATIHFTDNGQGEVVLLLHGFLENLTMWNTLVPHVIKNHRVVCVDLLGHGATDSIGYIHSMEQMAEAVLAVLQHLKIDKTIVIGHSMGGYVGLALLDMNPGLIKGLCLMNSTPVADSPDKKRNRDRAIIAVKHNYKTFVNLAIANLFRPKSRTLYKVAFNNVKEQAQQITVQSIVAALEGMKIRKDRLKLFQKASINKLVILGKKDAVLDYDLQRSYYKNSGINIVAFPDGHMSHIENNEGFTYNIMHFIENI